MNGGAVDVVGDDDSLLASVSQCRMTLMIHCGGPLIVLQVVMV